MNYLGLVFTFLIAIFFVSYACADLIPPGTKSIPIVNSLDNIRDFPNFTFVSYGDCPGSMENSVKVIDEDGVVPTYYKFCKVYVYAIANSNFDASLLLNDTTRINTSEQIAYKQELKNYFNISAKLILSDLEFSQNAPETSAGGNIQQHFMISLNTPSSPPSNLQNGTNSQIKNEPQNGTNAPSLPNTSSLSSTKKTGYGPLFYWYLLLPFLALIVIVIILVLRKRK